MDMSGGDFYQVASRGRPLEALRSAAVFAALWAIGTAWSTAIREIAVLVFPHSDMDAVLAELVAAAITTVIALAVSLVAAHDWKCFSSELPTIQSHGSATSTGETSSRSMHSRRSRGSRR